MEYSTVYTTWMPRARIAAVQAKVEPARSKKEQTANARMQLATVQPLLGRVDLALFPELSTMGDVRVPLGTLAEPLGGETCRPFQEAADASGTLIGFGLPLLEDGEVFNSYVFVGPGEEPVVCHQSRGKVEANTGYINFMLGKMNIGVAICRDAYSETTQRRVLLSRPELVLIPAITSVAYHYDHYASAWQANVLSINHAGHDVGLSTFHWQAEGEKLRKFSLSKNEGIMVVTV